MNPICEKHGCLLFAEGTPEQKECEGHCQLEGHAYPVLLPESLCFFPNLFREDVPLDIDVSKEK